MYEEPKPRHMIGRDGEARVVRVMDKAKPAVCDALRECAMGQAPWPLFLTGNIGAGKTCAALALLDYVREHTQYWTVADLCAHYIDVQFGRVRDDRWRGDERMTTAIFWRRWSQSELCVLDELGQREKVKDPMFDTTKKAIDLREGRPLIIVSNLSGDEIGDIYDDRIASRCVSGTRVKMKGQDRRLGEVEADR